MLRCTRNNGVRIYIFTYMKILLILTAVAGGVVFFMRRNRTMAAILHNQALLDKFMVDTVKNVAAKYTSDTPDSPVSFGYKMNWLAIKTTDAKTIANELAGDKYIYTTNWSKGVDGAYRGATFVSPSIDGWILVINPGIADPSANDDKDSLIRLSQKFGEVHLYGTHRVSSAAIWAKLVNGNMLRAVSIGDYELYAEIGNATKEEEQLIEEAKATRNAEDFDHFDEQTYITLLTDEEWVMKLAGIWSIDPTILDERKEESQGYIF